MLKWIYLFFFCSPEPQVPSAFYFVLLTILSSPFCHTQKFKRKFVFIEKNHWDTQRRKHTKYDHFYANENENENKRKSIMIRWMWFISDYQKLKFQKLVCLCESHHWNSHQGFFLICVCQNQKKNNKNTIIWFFKNDQIDAFCEVWMEYCKCLVINFYNVEWRSQSKQEKAKCRNE